MKKFSILFLKTPHSTVRQFSISYAFVYLSGLLLVSGGIALGALYHSQSQQILNQQKQLQQQTQIQANLQQEIDSFSEKEELIVFLESYVEELKKNTYDSEKALKDHIALSKVNTEKLMALHNNVCQIMSVECLQKIENLENPVEIITWMHNADDTFKALNESIHQFNNKKVTVEEQERSINRLKYRISETELELAKHLELVKSKEKAINKLSERIKKVTGIEFTKQFLSNYKLSPTSSGRGGPAETDPQSVDNFTAESNLHQYLRESTSYYNTVVQSIESLSKSIEEDSRLWLHTPTLRPLKKISISDHYGKRIHPITKKPDFHTGVDLSAKKGTPVYAPANGVVVFAGRQRGYGKLLEIEHGLGFYKNKKKKVYSNTRYGHLSKILVKRGQQVKRGDEIALVGNTGISTGPHLHYEIIINSRRANPLEFINHFESHLARRR